MLKLTVPWNPPHNAGSEQEHTTGSTGRNFNGNPPTKRATKKFGCRNGNRRRKRSPNGEANNSLR
jgi:hypothetical protein